MHDTTGIIQAVIPVKNLIDLEYDTLYNFTSSLSTTYNDGGSNIELVKGPEKIGKIFSFYQKHQVDSSVIKQIEDLKNDIQPYDDLVFIWGLIDVENVFKFVIGGSQSTIDSLIAQGIATEHKRN